jgi:hypothetical protein
MKLEPCGPEIIGYLNLSSDPVVDRTPAGPGGNEAQ